MKTLLFCLVAFVVPIGAVIALNVDSITEIDKRKGTMYYFSWRS